MATHTLLRSTQAASVRASGVLRERCTVHAKAAPLSELLRPLARTMESLMRSVTINEQLAAWRTMSIASLAAASGTRTGPSRPGASLAKAPRRVECLSAHQVSCPACPVSCPARRSCSPNSPSPSFCADKLDHFPGKHLTARRLWPARRQKRGGRGRPKWRRLMKRPARSGAAVHADISTQRLVGMRTSSLPPSLNASTSVNV